MNRREFFGRIGKAFGIAAVLPFLPRDKPWTVLASYKMDWAIAPGDSEAEIDIYESDGISLMDYIETVRAERRGLIKEYTP